MKIFKQLVLILIISFVFYIFGWLSYQNINIRHFLFNTKDQVTSLFKNVKVTEISEKNIPTLQTFELLIQQDVLNKLNLFRKRASYRNMLFSDEKEKFQAKLIFKSDTHHVKIRLKGGRIDHYGGDKWSIRVEMNEEIKNIPLEFSLQDPATRNFQGEWLYFKYLNHIGLKTIRYDFVNFKLNGVKKGIYALEESFYPSMFNEDYPIYAFDEIIRTESDKNKYLMDNCEFYLNSNIKCFNYKQTKKIISDSIINRGAHHVLSLRNGYKLSKLIDVEKFADLFASVDIFESYHVLTWKNIRFLYNPKTDLLEPIPYDANAGGFYKDILINNIGNDNYPYYLCESWIDLFYSNPIFLKSYYHSLKKILGNHNDGIQSYLMQNKNEISSMELYLSPLDSSNLVSNIVEKIKGNIKKLKNNMETTSVIHAFQLSDTLFLKNISFLPIKIHKLNDKAFDVILPAKAPYFPPSSTKFLCEELGSSGQKKLNLELITILGDTMNYSIQINSL